MTPINLPFIVTVIGWVLVIGPIATVLAISVHLVLGAAKDDEMIGGFVRLGVSMFLLGLGILALVYFTNIFAKVS